MPGKKCGDVVSGRFTSELRSMESIGKFVVEAKKQFDTRTIESPEDCPECMRLREALTQK